MSYNISEVSFPGLGIGPFTVNNTAFTIFGRDVKWYGIIICIGMILAVVYFMNRAKQAGVKADVVIDMALAAVPCSIIGARLYFVIFYGVDSFKEIFEIWNGGLAIYGGVIGGAIGVFVVCKIKKLKFFKITDMIIPGVMIGQILGRWGNFMNGEAYGAQTNVFCRMGLCNWHTGYEYIEVHPTFLYESLWNLVGFILINIFYKKKKFNGEILFWYAAWYGFGRTFIELLRQDSLYLGSIRISSLVGALCFAICVPIIVVLRVKHAKKVKAGEIGKDDVTDISFLLGFASKKNTAETERTDTEVETEETPQTSEKSADEPVADDSETPEEPEKEDVDGSDN